MCPNDTPRRRWRLLYDNEEDSDVKFLVGPEMLLIPAHSRVLAETNPVFKAMLEGDFPVPQPIHITDVDARAFENLLRLLYTGELVLQSVSTAVLTLCAAYKYLCSGLVSQCISYLDENIRDSTALEIFMYIRPYVHCSPAPSAPPPADDSAPSAPPLAEDASAMHVMPSCDRLLHNTLNFIDHNADSVLEQEHLEDLDVEGLTLILGRDTLAVSSENVVFSALTRWCSRECKRRHLELTVENRRGVLGEEAVYLVRYPLMKHDDFINGPMKSGLLDTRESAAILKHILGKPDEPVPKRLEARWSQLSHRRALTGVGDFPLSKRTDAQVSLPRENKVKGKKHKCEGKKDKKRKKSSSPSPDREKRSTGSKIVECLCGAIACILD